MLPSLPASSTGLLLLLALGVSAAGGQDTWVIEPGDRRSEVLQVESFDATVRGPGGQHFRLRPWPDSWMQLVRRVPAISLTLDELPSVRVKASRDGVQFAVRVVLPRAIDQATGLPHTVLLEGDRVERALEWSTLRIPELAQKLAGQVRVLRSRHGEVDAREAYIDLLLIKVLGIESPDPLELWVSAPHIDALPVDGLTTPWSDPQDTRATANARASHANGQLTVNGRLFLPRVVRGQGETWEFLKSLGFNTIAINSPPTLAQHDLAQRLGLWLVAPPPPPEVRLDALPFDRVVAWLLDARSISDSREFQRPTVVDSASTPGHSVHADILLHRRHPLGTATELCSYRQWLWGRCANAHGNWVAIQTDLPTELVRQAMALGADREALRPQPEQVQALVLAGVTAGARGFWFDSVQRLDGDGVAARTRAATVKLANARLMKTQPWIVAGTNSGVVRCQPPEIKASALRVPRATLLVLSHLPSGAQRGVHAAPKSVEVTIPAIAASSEAWRLRNDRLQPVPIQRVAGGALLELELENEDPLIVITRDRLVLENLTRTTQALGATLAAAHEVLEAAPPTARLAEPDPLHSCPQQMHCAARNALVGYRQPVSAESSGAMVVDLLPHGDFEGGNGLQTDGWSFGCLADCGATVTLSPESARSGLHGLRLYCPDSHGPELASPASKRQPPVWVLTAPVQALPNQPVRIEGYVKIPERLKGARLLITDSLGGEPLQIEVQTADRWTRFSMLRAALEPETLRVAFSLTGPGTVFLDDLRITRLPGS